VPREVRLPDDALARKWLLQLARIWITFRTGSSIAHNMKHVPIAIFHARQKASPMAVPILRQKVLVIELTIVEIADYVH